MKNFQQILSASAAFQNRNGFTQQWEDLVDVKMAVHDALHDFLSLDLWTAESAGSQEEADWRNEDVEGDVLMVQMMIRNGENLADVQDFVPGVAKLITEPEVVQIMKYVLHR